MSPKRLHRLAAWLEMITWTLLIVAMILKYSGVSEAFVPVAGPIHGFGFLCFAAITVIIWVNNRWRFGLGVLGLIVSVIPYGALPFTLWADKAGHLEGDFRFRDREEKPANLPEQILAQLVRHPVRTVLIILVVLAVIFTLLLNMGQPYDPDAIVDSVS